MDSGNLYLIETMRVMRDGVPLLERHLARLEASARTLFGRTPNREGLLSEIARVSAGIREDAVLRLTWAPGRVDLEVKALSSRPETIALSPVCVSSKDALLVHKQSRRAPYEEAAGWAQRNGVGDALLRNERDQITESTRFCVFARLLGGEWVTPPLSDGLIDSVFRRLALETMDIQEASISLHDLEAVTEWALGNAVHGWVPVRWATGPTV